jgi:hypothetical protein
MDLANPVKDFIPTIYPQGDVTQWFGANKALYSNFCHPGGCMTGGHNGIDIVRPHGTQIFCVEAGIVVEALGQEQGFGTHVKVLSDTGFEWTYAHLSAIDCKYGAPVERGAPIGKMGNTGFVVSGAVPYWKDNPYAGTHLHLGRRKVVRWTNEPQWNVVYFSGTDKQIRGIIQDYDNGTFGAVPIVADDFERFVPPPKPLHRFMRDLEFGMRNNPDVRMLQNILKYEGLMPESIPSTGNYFEQTRMAVLAYQKRYGLITPFQEWTFRGKYCYQITRVHLNSRYGG